MPAPPTTVVSFVRHAHAPYVPDAERTRGLSRRGRRDAARVTARLADLADVVATSPYERARATVEGVADAADAPLIVDEDLRERELAGSHVDDFEQAVEHLWANPNASHPGGESHAEAQARGVAAVDRLVEAYPDRHVVVGTHGTLMALVFNAYDPRYGREFWSGLTMPDVYEVTFVDGEAFSIARTWTPEGDDRAGDADRDPAER
ncbi:histidine phosphatase family protein [Haloferax sp. Atlit-10N]|uniref:histidine phosphatase family protein n=1 Tax=Haloferax TaxID=2251 RepID=UPI0006785392|nr:MULTISPECIES: histidine phosphatase family protein [Haloferax]RDZ42813.1 histidine phosphatase family protein [Haloferax sp. Atlit-19N]RDZ43192.1 histidine phosphatase family protein [Haloferax sp. Atlit-16N]RDZ57766.1 histidine phosphatase family protein [Haloferax sp. Atlit-10N]